MTPSLRRVVQEVCDLRSSWSLALGVGGPAVALADGGDDHHGTFSPTVTKPASDDNESVAGEQKSGEQGDEENTDLANEVETADDQQGVGDELKVGDGQDGQLCDDDAQAGASPSACADDDGTEVDD